MTLREKMKVCGVSLKDISESVPEANYPAVSHILNEQLAAKVVMTGERLCQEKAESLKKSLETI